MTYNMYAMTAASKILPLCTWVKVSNLKNGKSAIVQINDRGPICPIPQPERWMSYATVRLWWKCRP